MDEPAGFTGKEYDEDVELYYFNARWYDPELGRFVEEDPLADDPNLYSYGFNSPVNYIDPTGMVGENLFKFTGVEFNGVGGMMGVVGTISPEAGMVLSVGNAFVGGINSLRKTEELPDAESTTSSNGSFLEKVRNFFTGNKFRTDEEVADEYNENKEKYKEEYIKNHGQQAWDVLEFTYQNAKMSFGSYMAKKDLTMDNVSNHLTGFYARHDRQRREMIAQIGLKFYENNNKNSKQTLAYTADLCKYLSRGNKRQFVYDLVHAFSSQDLVTKLAGMAIGMPNDLKFGNWRNENINALAAKKFGKTLSDVSFSMEYRDEIDPGSDQTHHFVAFVAVGYELSLDDRTFLAPKQIGSRIARAWDPKGNEADVRLGIVGVQAGIDIAYGGSFWDDPGEWIRRNL